MPAALRCQYSQNLKYIIFFISSKSIFLVNPKWLQYWATIPTIYLFEGLRSSQDFSKIWKISTAVFGCIFNIKISRFIIFKTIKIRNRTLKFEA